MRRNNGTSGRKRKLTPEDAMGLDYWYFYERTFKHKAEELGVTVRTLHRYIHREHKPRKPVTLDAEADHIVSVVNDVPRGTLENGCTPGQF